MNSAIGYSFDPVAHPTLTKRIDWLDPLYVREFIHWDIIEFFKGTIDWREQDKIIKFNHARGCRLMLCIHGYPAWMAALAPADWMKARNEFVKLVLARYGSKIYALECQNEPSYETPASYKPGYIPGMTNEASMLATLLRIYQADRAAVRGTGIKLAGPSWSSQWDEARTKKLYDAGAVYNICTFHQYTSRPEQIYPACMANKAAAGGRETHCNEFALFPQKTSTLTGEQGAKQVTDAITAALAFRRSGVIPYPHTLLGGTTAGDTNGGFAGYGEADANGVQPMKDWCRAFLWVMRAKLTPTQLAVTP